MKSYPKRLIEVDLPIKKISAHARREKSIRHGHISTLHIWWARRPLAACRAVICAACCTRVEGINHCHACLKDLAAGPSVRRRPRRALPLTALVLGLAWLALVGMMWLVQGRLAP